MRNKRKNSAIINFLIWGFDLTKKWKMRNEEMRNEKMDKWRIKEEERNWMRLEVDMKWNKEIKR